MDTHTELEDPWIEDPRPTLDEAPVDARFRRSVRERKPLIGMFRDRLRIAGDITSPAAPAEEWESMSNPDQALDPDIPSGP